MHSLFEGRRLSIPRVALALLVLIVSITGIWAWLTYTQTASKKLPASWFAGYVDVTVTPSYTFESQTGNAYNNIILGFITGADCTPSWAGYYSLDEAQAHLDLDSRIIQTQRSDRSVTISLGGQKGDELATTCTRADLLVDAYRSLLTRYNVTSLDFDIEGNNFSPDALNRRAQAVAELTRTSKKPLTISLTLPADSHGLTRQGLAQINAFLDAGIVPANVNLMTMDFNIRSTQENQSTLIKKALNAAHDQYTSALYRHGKLFASHQVWQLLGATVLIGQNDTAGEYFTLENAREINTFALQAGLGRLSMWSLNRDYQCGENFTNSSQLRTFCSSVQQGDGEFAHTLSQGFRGVPGILVHDEEHTGNGNSHSSTYPTWDSSTEYKHGDKVIWNGYIYEALTPNRGEQPDSVQTDNSSAWRVVGPTL